MADKAKNESGIEVEIKGSTSTGKAKSFLDALRERWKPRKKVKDEYLEIADDF